MNAVRFALRLLWGLLLILVLVFAAFNSALVTIDAVFAAVSVPLGVALVAFFALGSLVGALGLYLFVVLRLKRDLKRARGAVPAAASAAV